MITWNDRVYGTVSIDDPRVEALIRTPTMTRLGGIMQSGPSALVFPFKTVNRLEHSLGVYILLRRMGASLKECVAGLLHDVSHTAFSLAIDFLITSDEQNHHEHLKDLFIHRPDIVNALNDLGLTPEFFADDSLFPLLEQPLPQLCADRIDYFLRDGLACGELGRPFVSVFLNSLVVVDNRFALNDLAIASTAITAFARMNTHWWASESESYIYNKFAELLSQALDKKVITDDDLLTSDDQVIKQIEASADTDLISALAQIRAFCPSSLAGFVPRVIPKHRWINPPVWHHGQLKPASQWLLSQSA